jgi:hypothetical protein
MGRVRRPVAVAVVVLGLFSGGLSALGRFLPVVLDRAPSRVGGALAVLNGAGLLISPVAVAVVGYAAGKRVDVSEAYVRIATVFAVLGGAGALAGSAVVTLLVVDDLPRTSGPGVLTTLLYPPLVTGVYFGLTGLAAASVAQFRHT